MVRCFFMAVLLGVTAAVSQGCLGESCLTDRIVYSGTKSGILIHRASGPSGLSGGISPRVQGPFDTGASGGLSGAGSCSSPQDADEPGWKAIAWLDVDGEEVEACGKDLSSPECAPDAHDPLGETEFTRGAEGLTTYRVELHDRE